MFWRIISIIALIAVVIIGVYSAIVARNMNMNLENLREEYSELQEDMADEKESEAMEEEKDVEEDIVEEKSMEEDTLSAGWSTYTDEETELIFDLPPYHVFGGSGGQIIISTETNGDLFPAISIDVLENTDLNLALAQKQKELLKFDITETKQETLDHPEFNLVRLSYQTEVSPGVETTVFVDYFEHDGTVYAVTLWESLAWEHLEEFIQRIRPTIK